MKINNLFIAVFIFAVIQLASCSGSETTAGIGGTGITTTGTITEFGSIFVNGIEFETDMTNSILVDDIPFDDQSGLALGMIVTVTGTVDDDGLTGIADTIFYDDDIEGPVAGLANNGSVLSFTVLNQPVTAFRDPADPQNPDNTVFDDTSFDTLVDDDYVEVSGFIDNSVIPAVIRATRIEKKGDSTNTDEVKIEGSVANLDTTGKTFDLGMLQINYSNSSFEDMQEADLADGLFVEVEGSLAGNLINAERIEREDEDSDHDSSDGDEVSLEGIVTEFQGINSFEVLGQLVDATNAEFKPESLAQTITNGVRVEVDGEIVNGVLIADEVED